MGAKMSDDPVADAWLKMKAMFDELEEQSRMNREFVDMYREVRGFTPINWDG